MDSVYLKKEECCGCNACFNICPKNAIEMQKDKKGYLYPVISQDYCIDCGLCQKVCPYKNTNEENIYKKRVYALKNKDFNIRVSSSSGGVFSQICTEAINRGGIVYGCSFDKDFNAIHSRATKIEECIKFRGSKYVQSNINSTFKDVKEDLDNKIFTVFSGTPCQVDGLKRFLKKEYENLFTVDIICHGVSSPEIFNSYKKYMVKKYKSKITDITFRSKDKKITTQAMKINFENKKVYYKEMIDDLYLKNFLENYNLRDVCFNCKYSNLNRVSDITLGDFWGIEKSIDNFDDKKGVSLVLVNTNSGEIFLQNMEKNFYCVRSNTINCLQQNLKSPTIKPQKYEKFWEDYYAKGANYIMIKYGKEKIYIKVWKLFKKVLKKIYKIIKNNV